ncbi:MAG: DUF2185 domain-containing protein, partial [Tannerellaceae bacterium]|nr:DUF2185 domain-containing protein [Tannerellaceae bacterium]
AIEDLQTLKEACDDFYNVHYEFEQFQSFWDGTPVFDVNQLNPDACKDFTQSKDYAEHFLPFVGRRGFLAWDCNEKIAMARRTYACGLISEEDFWNFVRPLSQRANAYFKSWEEYAMSCFCGGLYFMFREQRNDEDKVENYYEISCNMLNHLFDTDGAWDRNGWFTYPGKKWVISAYEMKNLLVDWKGAAACIATDRILVDGCKVGYMYREEPDGDWDSGWRFMEGDETDDYMDDANNSGIYGLNTICNYSPDILPLLNAPYGTAYIRNKAGEFEEDRIEKRD